MQEILLKIRYFKRGLSKGLEKVNFIFSFEPSHFFHGQDYEKKKCLKQKNSGSFKVFEEGLHCTENEVFH